MPRKKDLKRKRWQETEIRDAASKSSGKAHEIARERDVAHPFLSQLAHILHHPDISVDEKALFPGMVHLTQNLQDS